MIVRPELISWDFVVLRISEDLAGHPGRSAIACLPRRVLGSALDALDRGHLDAILAAYVAVQADGRLLASSGQTGVPGLYRGIATGARLLTSEHGPLGNTGDRPGKRRQQHQQEQRPSQAQPTGPTPRPPGRPAKQLGAAAGAAGLAIFGIPATIAAAGAGVVVVAVVGGAVLLGHPPESSPPPESSVGPSSIVGFASPSAGDSGASGAIASGGPVSGDVTLTSGTATVRIQVQGRDTTNQVPFAEGVIGRDGFVDVAWDDRVPDANGGYETTQWLNLRFLPSPTGTATLGPDDTLDMGVNAFDAAAGRPVVLDQVIGSMRRTCSITSVRTSTGGIAGSVHCAGRYDVPDVPFDATATFAAEP